MRNKFEYILLSILLGIAVLLGLSFWLNIIYGFNLFASEHWNELARLQAEQIPISNGFYISICVAVFIFVFGLLFLYVPAIRRNKKQEIIKPDVNVTTNMPIVSKKTNESKKHEETINETTKVNLNLSQPPRLHLPDNMARVLQQRYEVNQEKPEDTPKRYDSVLAQIFTDHGYVVKPNPIISGFTPNLFAIAPNEIIWIGAVDTDVNKLQSAITRLDGIFTETLEDIKININAFIIDTKNIQTQNDSIFVFKSVEELKTFVSELPPAWPKDMSDADQDNFDAYSEYIDTIIKYVKNLG